jgi:ElaB/YqjD/DUF883 family membrane-anchored ribosome-binding protein
MATSTTPHQDIPRTKPLENAGETAQQVMDRGKEAASNVMDKARDAASNIGQKARDAATSVGHNISEKAGEATSAVGSGMQSLAGTLRENLPHSGVIGSATSSVASGLESGGRYIKEEGLSGMGADMLNLIRRNPLPALFIGVGVGFMLGRFLSRD